jgi:small subunit ribosomal protein S2
VGTKKQAQNMVSAVSDKVELPYVNKRWLGGTLTNFGVIKKRIKFFIDHREMLEKGKLSDMTKLERLKLEKKLDKIEERMGGLERMMRLPEAVFVLDINEDRTAVEEAKKIGIKTIGLVDTNSDPEAVDFPIPANDDALSSLRYVLGLFLKTVLQAKDKRMEKGIKEASTKN